MSSADRPDSVERVLLAAGTASYDCPEFPVLTKVPEALHIVVEALREFGFVTTIGPPGYHLDPRKANLRAIVRKAAAAAPVVVLYYTGHGTDLERDTYYLVNKKSRPTDLDETALAARDLLKLLTLRDNHGWPLPDQPTVLVILDCCYAGSAGMAILESGLRGTGNPNAWVIASAGPLEYAQQGLFAKAFCDALRRPTTGPSQRFVSLDSIVQAVNDAHADQAIQQARLFPPATGSTGIPPFFYNPRHQPGLAGLTVADQQHWLSRARAGPEESTTGFYLTGATGRLRAAERLVGWIIDISRGDLAIVTGSPGTGKSALLALPVLLADRFRRGDLLAAAQPGSLIWRTAASLPARTPIIGVHARGLNADQVASMIARALGRGVVTSAALLDDLDAHPEYSTRVIIVDAVDEASSPASLLTALLVPLASQQGLRMVVGARRHVLSGVGHADLTIDLDAGDYKDPQALTQYIHQLLVASEESGVTTIYKTGNADDRNEVTAAVAAAIARRSTDHRGGSESFLIGRLLALSARGRAEPVDVSNASWESELPASLAEAFDEDIGRLGSKAPIARALLTALAWAKGPGLPWENIWVVVGRALAGHTGRRDRNRITDEEVRWLLERAGAYVVEDLGPGGRSVYRLFHDLLAVHLRGKPATVDANRSPTVDPHMQRRGMRIEQAITSALLAAMPVGRGESRDWSNAHPYLRTYLAQHAAAAGPRTFSALLRDWDFLATADPVTLSPLLAVSVPGAADVARIYRRTRPLLNDDPRANIAYLYEAARALTGNVAEGGSAVPLYQTRLAAVRHDDSLMTFTGHAGSVMSVAFGVGPDGRLLLASGGGDGMVRLWDPITGAAARKPFTGSTHYVNSVTSVAFGSGPDGRLLLACCVGGDVRVWDADTGVPTGEPLTTSSSYGLKSVAFGGGPDGRLLLATAGHDGTVRLWDPITGAPVGEPLTGHATGVTSVAFGTAPDGRLLLVSSGADSMPRLWDPITGTQVGEPLAGHRSSVTSVALGSDPDGRLLLATAGHDSTVRLWDPITGAPVGEPLTGHATWVASVAFGTGPDGRLILASGSYDRTVRLWDPTTSAPVGRPLIGHTNWVESVAFGSGPDGRLLLASCSWDHTVRIWDPITSTAAGKVATGHAGTVASVGFGTGPDGRLLLATGGRDRTVRLWDPIASTPASRPLICTSGVASVAFGKAPDGRLLLASGTDDGTVRVWDAITALQVGQDLSGTSVAFGSGPGGRLLLVSEVNGRIRFWNPLTGDQEADPLIVEGFAGFGSSPDGRLLFVTENGETWVSDAITGTTVGRPFTGHTGSVTSVAFGSRPDGSLLVATGGGSGAVGLWSLSTGTPTGKPFTGHTGPVTSVAFGYGAHGRQLLVTGGNDASVRLWDTAMGRGIVVLQRRSGVQSIAVDGLTLAIGDDEGVSVIDLSKSVSELDLP